MAEFLKFRLKNLCSNVLAKTISIWCVDHENKNNSIFPADLSLLPDETVHFILSMAESQGILTSKFLSTLIHEKMTILCIGKYSTFLTDDVLQQMSCKNLVSLNLRGCNGVSSQCIVGFVRNCSNLKNLYLESCSHVVDDTIESLVQQAEAFVEPSIIANLNLSSTNVTTKTLWFLLNSIPSLVSLSFQNIRDVDSCTLRRKDNISSCNLKFLDMLRTPYNELLHVVQVCTNILHLKLDISSCIRNDDVKLLEEELAKHSELKHLELSKSDDCKVGKSMYVFNLPKLMTRQLQSLQLTGPISLYMLNFSPQKHNVLSRIILRGCLIVQPILSTSNPGANTIILSDFVPTLQSIQLDFTKFKDVSLEEKQEIIRQLLVSHSQLHELSLISVPIDEETLLDVLRSSTGSQLEKLTISCYDNITWKSMNAIGEFCPKLKWLQLFHCWIINSYQVRQFNEHMKTKGRELDVVTLDFTNNCYDFNSSEWREFCFWKYMIEGTFTSWKMIVLEDILSRIFFVEICFMTRTHQTRADQKVVFCHQKLNYGQPMQTAPLQNLKLL